MQRTDYTTVQEILADFAPEELVHKVNQFHRERNKRQECNATYQKTRRVEYSLMKAKLAELQVAGGTRREVA